MKNYKSITILLFLFLFVGCSSSKMKMVKNEKINTSSDVLVIGTFSRESGDSYMGSNTITIFNEEEKVVKIVREIANESLSLKNNPYSFDNDFVTGKFGSSMFSFFLPLGEYYISNYSVGRGMGAFVNKSYLKLDIKNAHSIVYLGDFLFEPVLEAHPLYKDKKNIVSANCTISNKMERDFNKFKRIYTNNFFKNDNIYWALKKTSFNLNKFYSDSDPMLIFFPPVVIK